MTKTLSPSNDRILIRPIDEGEQTYGNIVIPDMGKEKPEMGEVLAVGPGRQSELDPSKIISVRSCKVGDTVLLEGTGFKHKNGKDTYHIYRESELLSVLNEK